MERHGHDQPAFYNVQQPNPRRAARAAGRRISRSRILSVLCQQRAADFRSGGAAMRDRKMKIALSLGSILLSAAATSAGSTSDAADVKTAHAAPAAANKQDAAR